MSLLVALVINNTNKHLSNKLKTQRVNIITILNPDKRLKMSSKDQAMRKR